MERIWIAGHQVGDWHFYMRDFQNGNAAERDDTPIRIGAVRGSIINVGDLSYQTNLNQIPGTEASHHFVREHDLIGTKWTPPPPPPPIQYHGKNVGFCNPNDSSRGFQWRLMDV